MEYTVTSFPLLNLPTVPLKRVIQNMEMFHQLGLSILSERSKDFVKSLNLEVDHISLIINDIVYLSVCFRNSFSINCYFYTEEFYRIIAAGNRPSSTEIYTPHFVKAVNFRNGQFRDYQWKKLGFEIKDWINHFFSVFHHSKLDQLLFSGKVPFDLKSLQTIVSDITVIGIEDSYPDAYIQKIVQAYSHVKQISLRFDDLRNLKEYHNIFCQGFDIFSLTSVDANSYKLDDLLILNSRSIRINANMNENDFNVFLKHWINGSNPRMEHMVICTELNVDEVEEILLDGLNYQIVSTEQERTFKRFEKGHVGSYSVIVKGGFDIHRKDGKTATIICYEDEERIEYTFDLEIFVWQ